MLSMDALTRSDIPHLKLLHRGKVRDVYDVGADRLLIVATDRLSAFDVVLPDPIPGKGAILTQLSDFWFAKTRHIIANHLLEQDASSLFDDPAQRLLYGARSVLAKKLRPVPIEAVVRGYLAGSAWQEYQASGTACGMRLPQGLRQSERLPEPLFTPSTKAAAGAHDQNISLAECVALIGETLTEEICEAALRIYRLARDYALGKGILVADTKLEFGLDAQNRLWVMDEMLTPDSSRFWSADEYRPGSSPPSFDKQIVRDWLNASGWNKQAPGPKLPQDVISETRQRYLAIRDRLMGS